MNLEGKTISLIPDQAVFFLSIILELYVERKNKIEIFMENFSNSMKVGGTLGVAFTVL